MSYGQDKKTKSIVTFKPELTLYIIAPNNFGNNYLAEANESKIGIGTNLNFIEVHHFKLGMGYDYIGYSITDVSRAGNIGSSRYNAVYGLLEYEFKLSNELYLQPYLGYGSVKLNFKSGDRSFGHQTGNDFRIGCSVDYKLDKTISAFAGFGYVSSSYDIKTAPEFVSFYDNSKMLQINIGFKIN
ncbi:outer membrane beta-barrel protein [Flavobacterium sp.]|uniref:outer membrane beta-barrel protein n=1 Tax=Flavobacterium sp. TaxID=239 RepID=UPI00286DD6C3|nr:outer membrane beta-barrel protein [Flavobacterium sp.]